MFGFVSTVHEQVLKVHLTVEVNMELFRLKFDGNIAVGTLEELMRVNEKSEVRGLLLLVTASIGQPVS